MHYLKRELWGYSLWQHGKQYGAGVSLPPFWLYKQPTGKLAARIWRKHGIARIDGETEKGA